MHRFGFGGEDAVEVTGEVALEAAADSPAGFALGPVALDVGLGGWLRIRTLF